MQGTGVVDVDGGGCDLEDTVTIVKTQYMFICPVAESTVFWQAVSADPRAGKDHIAVCRAHLDRLDHLYQVNAIAFGKKAPFVQVGQYGGTV